MTLQTDGIIAETLDHSCLVCRHYRMVKQGREIVCDHRSRIVAIPTEGWSDLDALRAGRRAKTCAAFDDMRPEAEV